MSDGRYRAYPKYKNSGVEWAPSIPDHWDHLSLRWTAILYAGGTPSKDREDYWDNGTVPWINSGAVNQKLITEPSTYISRAAFANSSAKWIPKRALVMALAGQGKTKGMVARLGIETTCNQSMAAIVPSDLRYSDYLYWWLESNYENVRNLSGGDNRDGLNLELLGSIQCPRPLPEEQIQIAKFLDHETAKIDRLIEKQEALIRLLKEKRQAVISHAVTKGLNPHAPLKDCGIPWLGQVPVHWEVKPLLTVAGFEPGKAHEPFIDDDGAFVCVNSRFVSTNGESRKNCTRNITPARRHDILMVMSDLPNGRALAKAYFVQDESNLAVNQRVCAITAKECAARFLYYFLDRNAGLLLHDDGVSQTHLSNANYTKLPTLIPPKEEQIAIAAYLDRQTQKMDALVRNAESAISVMQERRTALISAAVTGKIDVRHWQPSTLLSPPPPKQLRNIHRHPAEPLN